MVVALGSGGEMAGPGGWVDQGKAGQRVWVGWQGLEGWVGQGSAGLGLCMGQGKEAELLRAGQGSQG